MRKNSFTPLETVKRLRKEKENKSLTGFTLIEILIYISVLVVIFITVLSSLIWLIRFNTKIKVMEETLNNATRAMEIMSYEIREAKDVYTPTSILNTHPGQLSLKTGHYLPEGEETTFIDFFLCDAQICLKKESQDPVPFTPKSIEVSNLVFREINSGNTSSVEIDLTVDYKNPSNRPEEEASVNLKSTVSLRSY